MPAESGEAVLREAAPFAFGGAGKLAFATQKVVFDETYGATHAECLPGDNALLAVSDSAGGVNREMMSHVAEPFSTTKVKRPLSVGEQKRSAWSRVMPQANGRQLADRLSAARPWMKCLFMSGYTANVIAHRGMLEEGVSFIAKPFSLTTLAGKARAVLDGY